MVLRMKVKQQLALLEEDVSRVIEMAWEDRTPFESVKSQFGLSEANVIEIMRNQLSRSGFKLWRKRVTGRKTKHIKLRSPDVSRAYCATQYKPR